MDNYHEHAAISRTALKCFRESRRLYHARHVLRLPEAQMKPTAAMKLGTMAHAELLEPGSLESQFAILEDFGWKDFLTKAARQWREEQEVAGKIVVKRADIADKIAIAKAATDVVADWFTADTLVECPLFWRVDDLDFRCKPDWMVPTQHKILAFDFKTTDDPTPTGFARTIEVQELWLQQIHYQTGITARYDMPVDFYFVVVESKYPYRASIHRIEHDHRMHAEYQDTLRVLKECMDTGNWAEPWEPPLIHTVTLRDRAFVCDSMVTT